MKNPKIDSSVGLFTQSGRRTELKSGDELVFSSLTGAFRLKRRGALIRFGKFNGSAMPSGVKRSSAFVVFAHNLALTHGLSVKVKQATVSRLVVVLV